MPGGTRNKASFRSYYAAARRRKLAGAPRRRRMRRRYAVYSSPHTHLSGRTRARGACRRDPPSKFRQISSPPARPPACRLAGWMRKENRRKFIRRLPRLRARLQMVDDFIFHTCSVERSPPVGV